MCAVQHEEGRGLASERSLVPLPSAIARRLKAGRGSRQQSGSDEWTSTWSVYVAGRTSQSQTRPRGMSDLGPCCPAAPPRETSEAVTNVKFDGWRRASSAHFCWKRVAKILRHIHRLEQEGFSLPLVSKEDTQRSLRPSRSWDVLCMSASLHTVGTFLAPCLMLEKCPPRIRATICKTPNSHGAFLIYK